MTNLFQVGTLQGDVRVSAPRTGRWPRLRILVVGMVVALIVSAAVVVKLWTEDAPADPVSVVAKVGMGSACGGGWVVPDPGSAVVPFPEPVTGPPTNGVQADGDAVTLTVRGRSGEAVVLESMWAEVVARRPAVRGVLLPTPCEGELTPRYFGVDLTRPAPTAKGRPGKDGGEALPAPAFPFTVSDNDPEQFVVAASSPTEYVEWRLHLVWTAGDQRGEAVVDDGGRPFRTTALSAITATMCVSWEAGGWAAPSPELPCEQRQPESTDASALAGFAGQWHQHAGELSIAADGTARMEYQTSTDEGLPLFPELELRVTSASATTAKAEVVASTDPAAPVGATFVLTRAEQGLDVTDPAGNISGWCDNAHDDCGA